MFRIFATFISLILLLALVLPAAAAETFPDVIQLPKAFRPEGITSGIGHTFYAGSLADGTILEGNLRTGEHQVLVPGQEGQIAVGMSFDNRSGNLFVAGGTGGVGRVYDTRSGDLVTEIPMASGGPFGDFINDAIVTQEAVFFTNSFAPVLYRVPLGAAGQLADPVAVEKIPLSGDWVQAPGPFVFNANGIEATNNGMTLIVVNSTTQAVFLVDPATGQATRIDLGGELVPNGDGLVLLGKTLYVVQNQMNKIGVISLSADLSTGTVGEAIENSNFVVPTTALAFGDSLYAVNAKFGTPPDGTPYEIVKVSR